MYRGGEMKEWREGSPVGKRKETLRKSVIEPLKPERDGYDRRQERRGRKDVNWYRKIIVRALCLLMKTSGIVYYHIELLIFQIPNIQPSYVKGYFIHVCVEGGG